MRRQLLFRIPTSPLTPSKIMTVHLHREIESIKRRILSLSALVEEQVSMSVEALLRRDEELAELVCQRDERIDQLEVEVEEECLKVLALHQPVAVDLRFLVAVLKINSDLERIGDLAVNIAKKAIRFAKGPPVPIPFDIERMWRLTESMLRDSIKSLINIDSSLAANICVRDDEVDDIKKDCRHLTVELISNGEGDSETLLTLMAAVRNLERIADHATNIAEDVIYMIEGKIMRHSEWHHADM